MSSKKTSPETPPESAEGAHRATTQGHREARAEALQRALRDNLRRRKAAVSEPKDASFPADEETDETTRKNDD